MQIILPMFIIYYMYNLYNCTANCIVKLGKNIDIGEKLFS